MNILIYTPLEYGNKEDFIKADKKWYDKEKSEPKKEIVAFSFTIFNTEHEEITYVENEVSTETFHFRRKVYDLCLKYEASYSIDLFNLDSEIKDKLYESEFRYTPLAA